MGMAASQARFLQLTARQNNVEYQGQQINQQRTLLSNESSQAYTSLLNMTVPTPPSTTDYTTTVYTFSKNASSTSTIDALYPNADGTTYTVTYTTSKSVIGLSNSGYQATITETDEAADDDSITGNASNYLAGGNRLYEMDDDFVYTDADGETWDYSSFSTLFDNAGLDSSLYYIYVAKDSSTGSISFNFILKSDAQTSVGEKADIWNSGTVTSNTQTTDDDAVLVFSSSGRLETITLNDSTYTVSTSTETDQDAYDDAYNQYEYEKYLYNQQVAEINAEISIIQIQDKKLELQLEQLDTERQTITTEIEAVQTVLDDNIEKSYKTFNG